MIETDEVIFEAAPNRYFFDATCPLLREEVARMKNAWKGGTQSQQPQGGKGAEKGGRVRG